MRGMGGGRGGGQGGGQDPAHLTLLRPTTATCMCISHLNCTIPTMQRRPRSRVNTLKKNKKKNTPPDVKKKKKKPRKNPHFVLYTILHCFA